MTPIDGRELTLDFDIPFFWETSAVENMNVHTVFADIARKIALTYLVRPTIKVRVIEESVVADDEEDNGDSLKKRELATLRKQIAKADEL